MLRFRKMSLGHFAPPTVLAGVALLFGMLFWIGCEQNISAPLLEGETDPADTAEIDPRGHDPVAYPPLSKVLADWKDPGAVFVVSAEIDGHLEPCGCSDLQSGGLARRADLIRQLRERDWPVTGLDAGGLLDPKRATRTQSLIKIRHVWRALDLLGYAAIGIGPEELLAESSGQSVLLQIQADAMTAKQKRAEARGDGKQAEPNPVPMFVSANAMPYGKDDPYFSAIRRFKTGELNVAVTSILGNDKWKDLFPEGANTTIEFTPPEEVLGDVIKKMKTPGDGTDPPDVLVLLSHAGLKESEAIARKFPVFDLVLSAGYDEPRPEPLRFGKTLLTTVGHDGKNVGVFGFFPGETDSQSRLRYATINLDKNRFALAPSMTEIMRAYQYDLEQQAVSRAPEMTIPVPAKYGDRKYIGSLECGECHTKAYDKWKDSPHNHAWESLIIGRKNYDGEWIPRTHDAECLSCHVTGWDPQQALRYDSGFVSEEETPHLMTQGCENCHGPGSKHAEIEWDVQIDPESVKPAERLAARKGMILTKEAAKRDCLKCHDFENSPKFDFDTYWPEIEHPWRD